jgi:molybdopterin converting factor small subunit
LRVTVKYTVPFRDDTGVREERYEIGQESTTIARVLDLIVCRHSTLSKFVDRTSEEAQRHHLVVAVNSRLARLSDEVHDGDSISLLLPVSGGYKE